MVATMLSGLGTTYQRIIMQEIQDTGNRWLPVFGLESIILTSLSNRTYWIEFTGTNLSSGADGPTGSVTGINISLTTTHGQNLVAEIRDLDIPDLGAFVLAGGALDPGEPNFALSGVAAFYNALTPGVINGSAGKDFFEWGTDPVTINAGKGSDAVIAGPGNATINLGQGKNDAIDFRNLNSGVTVDIENGTATAGSSTYSFSGTNTIFGTDLADILNGSSSKDRIFGRDADDIINGLGGEDTLYGDDGDDIIKGGQDGDIIFGNENDDRLFGGAGVDLLFGGNGIDRLWGGANGDDLRGGDNRDFLWGGKGNDLLVGGQGKDALSGQAGVDTLKGGPGDDNLSGNVNRDFLFGGIGNDDLFGGRGRDELYGEDGDDTLVGGADNDTLEGGVGDDTLDGGTGRDTFVFRATNSGDDKILSFFFAEDTIRIYGQTAADVSIANPSTGNFVVTHAQGTIAVFEGSDTFTIDDISFA